MDSSFENIVKMAEGPSRTAAIAHWIQIVSPEDLLVDRMAAWKYWESPVDGINSFLLYRAQSQFLDEDHLKKRALAEDVKDALAAVRSLYRKYPGDLPADEVLEKWSRKVG